MLESDVNICNHCIHIDTTTVIGTHEFNLQTASPYGTYCPALDIISPHKFSDCEKFMDYQTLMKTLEEKKQ